jgi:broad specificity phosphatase PhoE
MRKLILIKHASPQVEPNVPPQQWQLSPRGRESCRALANRLAPHQPSMIIASHEEKAAQTAQLLAEALNCPWERHDDLHEHDRTNVPHMRSADFISMMELVFRRPDERVLGEESATAALSRFSSAVDELLQAHPQQTLVIVTHGTVLALLLAQHMERPAFELWRRMGLPSFAVLTVPDFQVQELVEKLE